MKNYDRTRNAVYQINYHIVWCTKYRRQLLSDKITDALKELLMEICEDKDYRLVEVEIMSDHLHIFVSAPPRIAPSEIVKNLKGISARRILQAYPFLRKHLPPKTLWSPSYYLGTAGNVSSEVIQQYIKNQKGKK